MTTSPESWRPAAKLAPRWFLARVYRAQGKAPAVTANLSGYRRLFLYCPWEPPVAELEAFFKALDAPLPPRALLKKRG